VAELDLRVVKKDGAREAFQPDKIRQGLERACWKRPIPTDKLEQAIAETISQVYMLNESEISTERIGELVMEKLVDLDDVAYIRFASVYRQFKDIHDFISEVRPILDRTQSRETDDRASSATNGQNPG
jgi:transcriptional repressor NrdR